MTTRTGMTLLEVLIAGTLFTVLMMSALELMTGTQSYADMDNVEKQLEFSGKAALDLMSKDICNSAWTPSALTPSTNLSTFPRVWKNGDVNRPAPPAGTPPSFPYGDTFSFYRLRTEATIANASPKDLVIQHVSFMDTVDPRNIPTPMSQYWNAHPVTSLMLNDTWTDGQPIEQVVWESFQPMASTTVGTNWTNGQDPTQLRMYRYTVIPNPANPNLGTLVRQWRNGGSALDTDWPNAVVPGNASVVVDNVISVQFDTYLTEPDTSTAGLNLDQVRITLVLGRLLPNATVQGSGLPAMLKRTLAATYSLRSINTSTQ